MPDQNLIQKLREIILENLSNEQFGVAELAEASGMSRSTLLRKTQKETGMPASQYIKHIRLEESKNLLSETDFTISEIGFRVGFNSTSYFIKCFKEEFGASPGEFQKLPNEESGAPSDLPQKEIVKEHKDKYPFKWMIYLLIFSVSILTIWMIVKSEVPVPKDKSVAVLPFKNDSQDSTNIYIVNGLMDAILNNLQKVKDLKVISRTSVEKYRNSKKSIPEIAEELGVSYFVEGSGQKIDQQILLNVQLIDAAQDRQIWSEQYDRELKDIFEIQKDVAKRIALQVEAKITPEEEIRLEEVLTEDMLAYDYFLQGLDLLKDPSGEGLKPSIPLFNMAIERDPEFARAYAAAAMAYYYMDLFQAEKKHIEQVNYYAEKAFLLQPKIAQSLVAKAFSYMMKREYETAVTYFEKALEYHPNSAFVINYLADFYTHYIPNTEKYLEYSLKGIQLDPAASDSVALSYSYLHVSNAFMQTGFIEQALFNIDRSLDYNANNIYSHYVKAYAYFAQDLDIEKVNKRLLEIYQMDSTRLDVTQEVAKSFYNMEDYDQAWIYYKKLLDAREKQNLSLFLHENIKIAWVCQQLGFYELEAEMVEEYHQFADADQSIYQPLLQFGYYAYHKDSTKALDYLEAFSQAEDYHFWVLFLPNEPYLQNIASTPRFKEIMKTLENKFWLQHEEIREKLEAEDLI